MPSGVPTRPRLRPRAPRGPRPGALPVHAAKACALAGFVDIAAGVLPPVGHARVHALAALPPGVLGPLAAACSLGAGVLLLLLARGLERGRRRAWLAAVVLLPVGAVAQFAHQHSVVGFLVSLAPLVLLLRHRDRFAAPPDPRSRWRALANFVLMGAGSLLVGLAVVSAHPGRLVGAPSLADRLTHVLYGLCGLDGPVAHHGRTASTVALCLGTLGLLTVLTTGCLALRPARPVARLTPQDEARLRALLTRYGGRDALGRLVPGRDSAVVFSPSGRAAVTYRVVSGVMLAGGDPVGDVDAWPGAIERFLDEARAHSWTPAVRGCSETGRRVWTRETGLAPLGPGDRAVVDTGDLSPTGRATPTVRRTTERTEAADRETGVRPVRDVDTLVTLSALDLGALNDPSALGACNRGTTRTERNPTLPPASRVAPTRNGLAAVTVTAAALRPPPASAPAPPPPPALGVTRACAVAPP